MTRFGALAGSALAALCPILAEAQPLQGFYLGGALGPNIAGNMLSANQTTKMYTNVGPAAIVDLGWGFGNGLRAEIEGGYRSDAIGGISTRRGSGDLLPLANVSGTAGAYAAMANLAYDLPLQPLGIQPYIGAGLGYAWLNLAGTHGNGYGTIPATGNNTVTGPTSVTFGNAGGFAYQGFAGASLPIPGVPGLTASVEYRYFGSARIDTPVNRTVLTTVNGVQPSAGTHNGFFIGDQAVLIGLRYAFGHAPGAQAAAAEAPPPAPASRSFLVFFDWDKANLTERAQQIVAEAAATSAKVQHTRIDVNGYTDTSGSAKYNVALSIRRAQAVAAELVKDGVPKEAIVIQGFGETHLLVPTGPDAREAQNRRVEIIIT